MWFVLQNTGNTRKCYKGGYRCDIRVLKRRLWLGCMFFIAYIVFLTSSLETICFDLASKWCFIVNKVLRLFVDCVVCLITDFIVAMKFVCNGNYSWCVLMNCLFKRGFLFFVSYRIVSECCYRFFGTVMNLWNRITFLSAKSITCVLMDIWIYI